MSRIDDLTLDSSLEDVAEAIVLESIRRGHAPDETIAELSTGLQESGLRPRARNPLGPWDGVYQQDKSYPDRLTAAGQIRGFFDRLEPKRRGNPGAGEDPFANIFWLQQGPNWPSAKKGLLVGRRAYYDEIRRHVSCTAHGHPNATELYNRFAGTPAGGSTAMQPNPGHRGDPTFLLDLFKAWGLNVRALDGWLNRGHGDFGTIWGVVAHHTGSFGETPEGIAFHPSLGLASQVYLGRNGEVVLCGVGVAWHAGNGSWPGIAPNNANAVTIGVEAANDGGGTPGKPHRTGWSVEQYEAYTTLVAAVLWYLGLNSSRLIGHKDWAGPAQGKWDPGAIDMTIMRTDVQRKIDAGPGGVRPPVNAIDEKAAKSGWLGARHGPERPTADGVGRLAEFDNGVIYWHPNVGAWPVPAHLFETYAELGWEGGPLGYPVAYHSVTTYGDVQAFQHGVLLRKYGEAGHYVTGLIGNRYRLNDWQAGPLGWPTSNEIPHGGMVYQTFEHGRIAFAPDGTIVLDAENKFI